jgi:hypothetical protein
MPPFQFWFTGSALSAFFSLVGTGLILLFGWFWAAKQAQNAELITAQARLDQFSYTLAIESSVVVHDTLGDQKQQDLNISFKNTSSRAIQFGQAAISSELDNKPLQTMTGNGAILPAGAYRIFTITFPYEVSKEGNIATSAGALRVSGKRAVDQFDHTNES